MSWQNKDEFLKAASKFVPPSGNILSAAEKLTHAISALPCLRCPNCHGLASGIAGGQQLYTIHVAESGGKSHKANVPPCPISGLGDVPIMTYVVEPCGCRVDATWAGEFTMELHRRLTGSQPKAVVGMTPGERSKHLKFFEAKLSALYSVQSTSNDTETKEAIDYWIVICADQIQRLAPGAHNMKPLTKPLCEKVSKWADDNTFAVPSKYDEPGVPLFRRPDNTLSTTPSYAGQKPCGTAASIADLYGMVKMVPDNPYADDGSTAIGLAQHAMKHGIISPKDIVDKWQNILHGTWAGPATINPEVGQTVTKQWFVRYGDIYKVFITQGEAKDYADHLVTVTPVFAEKMKPKTPLQTLPVETQSPSLEPTPVAAPEPLPPIMPKHTKKKRTIRKIDDGDDRT